MWLFVLSFTIAPIICIINVIANFFLITNFSDYCGINHELRYVDRQVATVLGRGVVPIYALTNCIALNTYFIWDLTTLLLYIGQVIKFRKYKSPNPDVFDRIMSILLRVTILTLLYEIIGNLVVPDV